MLTYKGHNIAEMNHPDTILKNGSWSNNNIVISNGDKLVSVLPKPSISSYLFYDADRDTYDWTDSVEYEDVYDQLISTALSNSTTDFTLPNGKKISDYETLLFVSRATGESAYTDMCVVDRINTKDIDKCYAYLINSDVCNYFTIGNGGANIIRLSDTRIRVVKIPRANDMAAFALYGIKKNEGGA